jgi:hypothetical protein
MTQFDRKFKIWDYWISHSQLLLRSPDDLRQPKGTSESRNIDIIFVAVDYIELPTTMSELRVTIDATTGELRNVEHAIGRAVVPDHAFVLTANGRRHIVVAGAMEVRENDLELMQSSLDRLNDGLAAKTKHDPAG